MEDDYGSSLSALFWHRCTSTSFGSVCIDQGKCKGGKVQAALWNDDSRTAALSRLAARAQGNPRSYGSHGSVLEAGVAHFGRSVHVAAGQPYASESAARQKDRCERRRADRRLLAAW